MPGRDRVSPSPQADLRRGQTCDARSAALASSSCGPPHHASRAVHAHRQADGHDGVQEGCRTVARGGRWLAAAGRGATARRRRDRRVSGRNAVRMGGTRLWPRPVRRTGGVLRAGWPRRRIPVSGLTCRNDTDLARGNTAGKHRAHDFGRKLATVGELTDHARSRYALGRDDAWPTRLAAHRVAPWIHAARRRNSGCWDAGRWHARR